MTNKITNKITTGYYFMYSPTLLFLQPFGVVKYYSVDTALNNDNSIDNKDLEMEVNTNSIIDDLSYDYYHPKLQPIIMLFNISDLHYDHTPFIEKLRKGLTNNSYYTVFVKVRYSPNNFFMLGNQFGYKYTEHSHNELLEILNIRLDEYFEEYGFDSDYINYVQITFRMAEPKLLEELMLRKPEQMTQKDYSSSKDFKIPYTNNEKLLGRSLVTESNQGFITAINLFMNNRNINFLQVIVNKSKLLRKNHKDRIERFNDSFKFYLVHDVTSYVLAINIIDNYTVEKFRFSLGGVLISSVVDIVQGDAITRHSKGKIIESIGSNVLKISLPIALKPVEKSYKPSLFIENKNIGVIDTETYVAKDNISKIYALGFKTNLDKNSVTYYINDNNLNSNELVLRMINELIRPKYNNITFYCHNMSGYDIIFILKILYDFNDSNPGKEFKINPILRDSKIIKVTISKDNGKITILDSYAMLPDSLEVLGKSFEVETLKSVFPYKFSLVDNLFYTGKTPNISYYENISMDDYKNLIIDNWSFKEETIKYLINDLNSLYEVLMKANKQIFLDYNVNMSDSITISGLALTIFFKDYYKNNIPMINKSNLYKDIRQAYYGGITEVYRPYGQDLFYYDVNSLYPYVAKEDMPGLSCVRVEYYTDMYDIDSLFGFFYCRIETPIENTYLGLLPVRNNTGLIFPLGKWFGWYFSEQLKFAKENGYKIKVIKGYNFDRVSNVFKEYIEKIYHFKSNPISKTQKSMAKSLLNNLLGRFGIGLEKAVTKILTTSTFNTKGLFQRILSYKVISNNKILTSYIPGIDHDLVKDFNGDFAKVASRFGDSEVSTMNVASVAISAAITAYARIYISKLKLDILKNGGKLYYSDTDSIVTDIKLVDSLVSSNEIGKLKLEFEIEKAIFINGKLYSLIIKDGKNLIKAKGMKSNLLRHEQFISLLQGHHIKTTRQESIIDWGKGSVSIEDKNIVITNKYEKRTKLYYNLNNWVNTYPIIINNIEKTGLVVYDNNKSLIKYVDKPSSDQANSKWSILKWFKTKNILGSFIGVYIDTRNIYTIILDICILSLIAVLILLPILLIDDKENNLYQIDKDLDSNNIINPEVKHLEPPLGLHPVGKIKEVYVWPDYTSDDDKPYYPWNDPDYYKSLVENKTDTSTQITEENKSDTSTQTTE